MKCIQGLAFWCTEAHICGNPLDVVTAFDADALDKAIAESELDSKESEKQTILVKPDKFSHKKWQEWEESVYNYFSPSRNARGIPLSYVICR